jgi:ribosomal protein L29
MLARVDTVIRKMLASRKMPAIARVDTVIRRKMLASRKMLAIARVDTVIRKMLASRARDAGQRCWLDDQ